jgi:hypothetical protein
MKTKQIQKDIIEALKMCDLNNSTFENNNLSKEEVQNYLDYAVKIYLEDALKLIDE